MKTHALRIVSSTIFREACLYGIIGITSAILDFTVFLVLCAMQSNVFLANLIGMNIGMVNSFFCNSRFNFKKNDNIFGRSSVFFAIGYCGICISMGIFWIGHHVLALDYAFVKVMSIAIIAVIQFLLNKYVTFSDGNAGEQLTNPVSDHKESFSISAQIE